MTHGKLTQIFLLQYAFLFYRLQLTSADSRRYNQINNPSSHVTDGYNSWYMTNPPVYVPNYGAAINTHVPSQIHPSREDPRLFYQSQAYLQDNNRKNVNNEVSYIYPGREVLQATRGNNFGAALAHLRRRGNSFFLFIMSAKFF